MKTKHDKNNGFTLIELIIVITILSILAVIAIPKFNNYRKLAKARKATVDCYHIEKAITLHYHDTEQWLIFKDTNSTNQEGLTGKGSDSFKPSGWSGPYLEQWPLNPFNKKSNGTSSSNEDYQVDYRKIDGVNSLCIELSLPNYDEDIINYMDEKLDNSDGPNSGKFRYASNNRYPIYVIEKNPIPPIKDTKGNTISPH
ncbi:hypothetical protein SH2C18_30770 [Clostridium sediminicola]|uniref:type II secretion system protein n=1 Tax=Clostridium sediminicola TaxID=3114879 RepID=UPI0031F1F5F4